MKTRRIAAMILAFTMVLAFSVTAMAEDGIQMTGQRPEMNGMFDGKKSHGMRGGMNDRQSPEMNSEFNGQQPPEMNGEFNGQKPPEMNGERKDPFSEAIAALEDSETKDTLLALEEAVNTAIEAEMAAREAGEEDLSSYQEAVKTAQEALMTALQEAGIEIKVPADMGLNGGMKFNGQQPRMNNGINGQQPPEKPEGDLQPEVPSEPNE